jgi:hypothetical protein
MEEKTITIPQCVEIGSVRSVVIPAIILKAGTTLYP